MTETTKTSSRCECGALELNIKGAPVVQLVCHCSDCQDFSGMPYVEAAFFHADDIGVHGRAYATTTMGGTGFDKTYYSCESCRTWLYTTVAALNGASAVMANRLSHDKFEPQVHIWTSEKAKDVVIPTGIAQSSGAPPKEFRDAMVSSFWSKK